MPVALKTAPNVSNPFVDEKRCITPWWLQILTSVGAANGFVVNITVAEGGTGRSSLTAHYTLVGNGTGPVGLISPGTAGDVYTSNGAGADPSFQPSSASSDETLAWLAL